MFFWKFKKQLNNAWVLKKSHIFLIKPYWVYVAASKARTFCVEFKILILQQKPISLWWKNPAPYKTCPRQIPNDPWVNTPVYKIMKPNSSKN